MGHKKDLGQPRRRSFAFGGVPVENDMDGWLKLEKVETVWDGWLSWKQRGETAEGRRIRSPARKGGREWLAVGVEGVVCGVWRVQA